MPCSCLFLTLGRSRKWAHRRTSLGRVTQLSLLMMLELAWVWYPDQSIASGCKAKYNYVRKWVSLMRLKFSWHKAKKTSTNQWDVSYQSHCIDISAMFWVSHKQERSCFLGLHVCRCFVLHEQCRQGRPVGNKIDPWTKKKVGGDVTVQSATAYVLCRWEGYLNTWKFLGFHLN